MWMLALHVVMMDRVQQEPYNLVVLPCSAAEFGDESVALKPMTQATVELRNNVDHSVGVGLKAVSNVINTTTTSYTGWVSSFDQGGDGAEDVLFDISPLTMSVTISVEWFDVDADIDVTVYGGDWSNWGMLWENGDSLTFDNPCLGEWDAAVALANSASHVDFVVNVTTVMYESWGAVNVTGEVWLDPLGCELVTVTMSAPMGCPSGMVVAYDLVTGCEYDTLIIVGNGKPAM